MALSALQKADKAMDDHLLPASQMWKNSCRIMYQVILLSNCYQNEEKMPQTLDISWRLGQCLSRCKVVYRVWGKLVYPQNNLIFMLFLERFCMIKSQFYHTRNPDITRFFSSMSTKKDLEDFTLQGLIFYVAGG